MLFIRKRVTSAKIGQVQNFRKGFVTKMIQAAIFVIQIWRMCLRLIRIFILLIGTNAYDPSHLKTRWSAVCWWLNVFFINRTSLSWTESNDAIQYDKALHFYERNENPFQWIADFDMWIMVNPLNGGTLLWLPLITNENAKHWGEGEIILTHHAML